MRAFSLNGIGISLGIDIVDLREFERVVSEPGAAELIFTPAELGECVGRIESLGGRFAAKEAVSKAMRTDLKDIDLHELQVLTGGVGAPIATVDGDLESRLALSGAEHLGVSITHKSGYAIALAWLVTEDERTGSIDG
ncbi:MAG: holo-ACP synthase [Actinomycetia bacterium]|nr:holo-ACP synthase [Actinomycetes bacterium]